MKVFDKMDVDGNGAISIKEAESFAAVHSGWRHRTWGSEKAASSQVSWSERLENLAVFGCISV